MPDLNPLNDSDLQELERRLSQAPLSPTTRERERILYACGQAAGRAQMMRRVRSTTAVAALLGCGCAALVGALLLGEKSRPVAANKFVPAPVPEQPAFLRAEVSARPIPDNADDANRQLKVAGIWQLALNEFTPKSGQSREPSPKVAAEPMLTTSGPLPVEL